MLESWLSFWELIGLALALLIPLAFAFGFIGFIG
jgi:hypothetical protein